MSHMTPYTSFDDVFMCDMSVFMEFVRDVTHMFVRDMTHLFVRDVTHIRHVTYACS